MSIREWLSASEKQLLSVQIPSARLDAELLLTEVLQQPRTRLHAHPEELLSKKQLEKANKMLARRVNREPLAYIFEKKEFYRREFTVTSDTLIPRPESETIIDIVTSMQLPENSYAIDVGTGSGAIGLTLKMEVANIKDMILTDISDRALMVAKDNNRNRFHLNKVQYYQSDLLDHWQSSPIADLIVANLPYVDKSWRVSPETAFEPNIALFADEGGLSLIKKLIRAASNVLKKDGYLLLEADPRQHTDIADSAHQHDFTLLQVQDFIVALQRNRH